MSAANSLFVSLFFIVFLSRWVWWVLVGFGGDWWFLVGSSGFWWVLVGSGGFWWVLVGSDGFWSNKGLVDGNFAIYGWVLGWVLVGSGGF